MIRIFLFIFWMTLSVSAQNTGKGEVTYLDSDENKTTKNNASYYEFRTELKPGIWKYEKYFINRNSSKAFLVGDYNYLTQNGTKPLPDAFYEALAWQGLKENGVKAYTDLSAAKKEELKKALELYYPSTTKNCPN